MADYGRLLISKVIVDADITTATQAGVRPGWFDDAEHSEVFQWMLDYYNRYGESPTERALTTQFPNYRLSQSCDEPYDYYVDHFRDRRTRAILVDTVVSANEALNADDPKRAQNVMSMGMLQLGSEVSSLTDVDVVADTDDRYERYEERRRNVGVITGVATGFPTLDLITGGFHPEQFILIGGTAKQGKSFMLMKSAIAAQDAGLKGLFVSFEMSVDEQLARYDALTCGINANKIMHGTTSDVEVEKLQKGRRTRRNLPPMIVSADTSATTTVSSLSAKIEQHRPDIIFVDGVYLMENETGSEQGTPQAYTAISRGLKRLAQRVKIPLVATTQALSSKMGRDGKVSLHSLGWSSAWSQDADLVLGVERIEDAPIINLRVVAGRNVSPREIAIACNWEESILEEIEVRDGYSG